MKRCRNIFPAKLQPIAQDESQATYEPMLNKEMAKVDWTRPAIEIARQVRGLNPWPCAETSILPAGGSRSIMAKPSDRVSNAQPGDSDCLRHEGRIDRRVWHRASLELIEIQAPGAKRMTAKAYLTGKKIETGTRFGADEEKK